MCEYLKLITLEGSGSEASDVSMLSNSSQQQTVLPIPTRCSQYKASPSLKSGSNFVSVSSDHPLFVPCSQLPMISHTQPHSPQPPMMSHTQPQSPHPPMMSHTQCRAPLTPSGSDAQSKTLQSPLSSRMEPVTPLSPLIRLPGAQTLFPHHPVALTPIIHYLLWLAILQASSCPPPHSDAYHSLIIQRTWW